MQRLLYQHIFASKKEEGELEREAIRNQRPAYSSTVYSAETSSPGA